MSIRSPLVPAALLLTSPFVFVSPASAHDTWAVMKDYVVKRSTPAVLTGVSDHKFVRPPKTAMPREKVASVTFITPAGAELAAKPEGAAAFASAVPLKEKGTYVALLKQEPSFYSKTPDGSVPKNKKEASNVVDCKFSEKHGKAIFNVGSSGGTAFSKELGLPMEIVPLQDPTSLKAGGFLEVKVMFGGKPLASTVVFGTYTGFSEDSGTFAYTTSTNKEGVARIKLIKGGQWLLVVKKEEPYRDLAVCDKHGYAGSLTFQSK